MTDTDYIRMETEIRRLEAVDPDPDPTSEEAVKLYTLKAALLAYRQGLYPETEALPPSIH